MRCCFFRYREDRNLMNPSRIDFLAGQVTFKADLPIGRCRGKPVVQKASWNIQVFF